MAVIGRVLAAVWVSRIPLMAVECGCHRSGACSGVGVAYPVDGGGVWLSSVGCLQRCGCGGGEPSSQYGEL